MHRRLSFLALAALLLLGLAAFWASTDEAPRALERHAEGVQGTRTELERAPIAELEREGVREVALPVDTMDVGGPGAQAPRLEVLVVDRESRRPVADAEVCAITGDERRRLLGERPRMLALGLPDPFALPIGLERLVRTDATGRARLALERGELLVAARAPGSFGFTEVRVSHGGFGLPPPPPETGPVVVELAPLRALIVRVVDGSGSPVEGVPVVVGSRRDHIGFFPEWRGVSDAAGLARVEPLDAVLDRLHAEAEFVARLEIVAREQPTVVIPRDVGEAELTLPPCGELIVQTLDSEGARLRASRMHARARLPGLDTLASDALMLAVQGLEPQHGAVRFPFVEVGIEVLLRGEASCHESQTGECPAPLMAGATNECAFVFEKPSVTLAGRFVTERGAPVASASVRASGSWRSNISASFTFRTDADGRFRFPLSGESPLDATLRLSLHVYATPQHADREGRLDRSVRLERGDNELGDVVLQRSPLLVRGVVRDERGAPIAGARVWASWVDRPRERPVSNPLRMRDTDATGGFELHAACDEPDFELSASADGYESVERRPLAVGTSGVELVLRARASR